MHFRNSIWTDFRTRVWFRFPKAGRYFLKWKKISDWETQRAPPRAITFCIWMPCKPLLPLYEPANPSISISNCLIKKNEKSVTTKSRMVHLGRVKSLKLLFLGIWLTAHICMCRLMDTSLLLTGQITPLSKKRFILERYKAMWYWVQKGDLSAVLLLLLLLSFSFFNHRIQ